VPSCRTRKEEIRSLLAAPGWEEGIRGLLSCPPKQSLQGLFAALCSTDPLVRWHAVSGFGVVVTRIAEESMEDGRVVMRRLMWSLNDESGGIGWGAPEAMAEIMASHPGLAREFSSILRSYIHEEESGKDNFLELASLRQGALWGIARLAQADPTLAAPAAQDLRLCLNDADGTIRGLSCLALSLIEDRSARNEIAALLNDSTILDLYLDRELIQTTVSELASGALERLDAASG
jgi:hypothetical protein